MGVNRMATVYKKTITRPLPADAKIITRKGKQFAEWNDRRGKKRNAELTESGTRIKTTSGTWYAKYRDGDGVVTEVSTGCRDKQAAQSVLAGLVKTAERVRSKVLTQAEAEIGQKHADTLLTVHVAEYIAHLTDRRVHANRIKTTETRLNETAASCGWKYLRDMSADDLTSWLNNQRSDEQRRMSASVHNDYVSHWTAFGNWLIGKRISGKRAALNGEKRMLSNPFDGAGKIDEQADKRRPARALTAGELERLLDAAERRPMIEALTIRRGPHKGVLAAKVSGERRAELVQLGRERRLIYKTAILTGLRLNELRTLRCCDLSFGDVPFIKLDAHNEKSRKGSTLPLRSDLAAELKGWTAGKQRTESVFYVPTGLLRIMDRDCKAAGIPKKDADGCVVHVHALRHSFGTHLSLAGVAPRTAQAAMRHSKLDLTMGVYTDSRLLDTAGAIEAISVARTVALNVAPTSDQTGQIESIPDQDDDIDNDGQNTKKPVIPNGNNGFSEVGLAGFEPTTSTTPR
ncbi:MAG: tyrosine-type recombinase/integrase [Aureliella sp.]